MTMRKTDSKTTILPTVLPTGNMTESQTESQTTIPTILLTEEAAAIILAEIQSEDPDAICPSPAELVNLEAQGLTWNFETGQPEAECILIGGLAIPIVGTIEDGGRVQMAPWFVAKMGGGG